MRRSSPHSASPVPSSMTVLGPNQVAFVGGTPECSSPAPAEPRSRDEVPQTPMDGGWGFDHVAQKDAFLVFRSLCKLSMKAIESHDPR